MVKIHAKNYGFARNEGGNFGVWADRYFLHEPMPCHPVSFTYDFWIDTIEVTQKFYDSLMRATYTTYLTPTQWKSATGRGDHFPVYAQNWYEAALFCNARSRLEGLDTVYKYTSITGKNPGNACTLTGLEIDYSKKGYRMPGEAELDYAIYGGKMSYYEWFDTVSMESGWAAKNSNMLVHEVAGKKPNPYGLYDIIGNVAEFCSDGDTAWTLGNGPLTDPFGSQSPVARIALGGDFKADLYNIGNGGYVDVGSLYSNAGFRCVLVE